MLMTSPDFLCLISRARPLNNFALASRLSYFLWDSSPDDELLSLARQGKLTDSKMLREQTDRLLQDPKSQRFVKDFIDQWLGLWAIDNTTPDKDLYPEYDDLLKISSTMETQATFPPHPRRKSERARIRRARIGHWSTAAGEALRRCRPLRASICGR